MSLVTVLRSPSSESGSLATDSEVDQDQEDSSCSRSRASSFEGFFASKGAAYALPDGDFARSATKHGGEMQLHLQAMVNLLRDEDVLRLVVKLECQYPKRIRYLTVVSAFGPFDEEESIIMGVDWTDKATIGLVIPLYRDTNIKLDGDGGFKLSSAERTHDFKPVSVQTMWTALQWIHKCADNARRHNYYPNGTSHAWGNYYVSNITSDRSCLNEWNQMDDLITKRHEPRDDLSPEKELIMKLIRHKLKEVMLRVDLEETTCRQVRNMLEEETQMELEEYRKFVDQEMITILGQMDSASKIFDHVYLGSEWNASNLEELKENGVGYILNITREIDNFFPGTFIYYNVRVYDVNEAELLHHWENTYKFIQRAKEADSKVLVHCRMGISRSASTVIAYAMKEFGWSLGDTMKYVKARRSCVSPNAGFWKQLITYEGILNSSKQRFNKLFSDRRTQSDSTKEKNKRTRTARKKPKKYNTMPGCSDKGDSAKSGGEDTLDSNIRLDTESKMMKSEASSEESEEECVEGRVASEDTDDNGNDVFFAEAASRERSEAVDVPSTCLPHASSTPLSLQKEHERSDGLVENLSPVEKPSLHRVSSVPTFLSGGQSRQDLLVEDSGNLRRSSSLRERGRRKVKETGALSGDKSATAVNLGKSCAEGQVIDPSSAEHFYVETHPLGAEKNAEKPENELEKPQAEEVVLATENTATERMMGDFCKEPESSQVEVESAERVMTLSSLPRDLLGVVESGFVKRHSRNFEEGIVHLPSETDVFDDGRDVEEENREGRDFPSAGDTLDQEDVNSFPGEEPEPGIVKKHKEGYEMKHRESAKTTLSLQQRSTSEGEDVKQDEGGVDVISDVTCVPLEKGVGQLAEDSESPSAEHEVQPSGMGRYDHGFSVNVEKLLHKVNEDMKKEVLSRRNVCSRKFQEGQTLADNESSSAKESLGSVDGENWKEHNGSNGVGLDQYGLENENPEVPIAGLVKRNTLILEGKARDFSVEDAQQGEGVVSKGEATGAAVAVWDQEPRQSSLELAVHPSGVEKEQSLTVAEEMSIATEGEEDRGNQQDMKDVPRKGLVKRHTLLIEERLQPLEQEATKEPAEKERENGMELTEKKASDSPSEEGELRFQIEPTRCADTADEHAVAAEEDSEALSGLVKREKLRIEERLQPAVTPEPKEPTVSEMQQAKEDIPVLEADVEVGNIRQESDKQAQDDNDSMLVEEYDQSEIGIDTSSVVKVKEHAQHLENILRENQPESKVRCQKSAEELSIVDDRGPRIVIIPRSMSVDKENTDNKCTTGDKHTSDTMETLSDSALWDAEKASSVVNWATGNVKQRTQILEDIIRDSDKDDWEDNERKGSSVWRHESMPKAIPLPAKLVLRRRSFSDVTENSSISARRDVVYTVQLLKDSSTESVSSSSLPRNWSPRKEKSESTSTKE